MIKEETVMFDNFRENFKEKANDLRWKATYKWREFKSWVKRNPEEAAVVIPAACGLILKLTKMVLVSRKKDMQLEEERELKENYCYDRALGHYWQLRRALTNREWREIEERKEAGETLGSILESMRVLK